MWIIICPLFDSAFLDSPARCGIPHPSICQRYNMSKNTYIKLPHMTETFIYPVLTSYQVFIQCSCPIFRRKENRRDVFVKVNILVKQYLDFANGFFRSVNHWSWTTLWLVSLAYSARLTLLITGDKGDDGNADDIVLMMMVMLMIRVSQKNTFV